MAAVTKPSWFRKYIFWNYRSYSALRFKMERKLTQRGTFFLAAAVIAGARGLDTTRTVAYQAFAVLGVLILMAFLTRRLGRLRFEAKRQLPAFGTVGQPLPYRLIVTNLTSQAQDALMVYENPDDPRPSLMEFVSTPEPGEEKRNAFDRFYGFYRWVWLMDQKKIGTVVNSKLEPLPPQGKVDHLMEATPLRRGKFLLDSVTIGWPDPFGLFRSLQTVELNDHVMILPKRYPVPPVSLPGESAYQAGGVNMAGSVGSSEEFVALRDYRPGDPLRRIHWRSTAREGRPIVKEYQDEYFVRHALILDTYSSVAVSDEFEEAVSVASSFVCSMEDSESLLDLMFVGDQAYCFTAGRGLAYSEQMLEILATVQPNLEGEFKDLEEMVIEHAHAVSGVICVFQEWDEERASMVRKLQARSVPMMAFLMVTPDAEPDGGFLAMEGTADRFVVLKSDEVEKGLAAL